MTNQFLKGSSGGGGSGDVTGPGSSTDNALARFDGATGKIIQNSGAILDDTDNLSGIVNITLTGTVDGRDVATDGTKLDTVETNADVTDTANVTAAGALMADGTVALAGAWDMGSQATTNVNIDSGTITGITDLAVADGGTGVSILGDGYILLGSGTGPITALDVTAKGSLIVGDGTTDPVALAAGTDDYVLTADSAQASGLKWAAVGGGLTWVEETTTSRSASVNEAIITNNASLVTVTLPTTAAVGDQLRVVGLGAGGFKIGQNASEIIHFLGTDTTTGTGGSLASTTRYDAVELVCVVANNEWVVISSVGNITIV